MTQSPSKKSKRQFFFWDDLNLIFALKGIVIEITIGWEREPMGFKERPDQTRKTKTKMTCVFVDCLDLV